MQLSQPSLQSSTQVLKTFGQQIQQQRLAQNLTQKALAEKSGVAYSTLRKVETSGTGSMGDYLGLWAALGLPVAPVFSAPPSTSFAGASFTTPNVLRQRARRQAAPDTGTAVAVATTSPQVPSTPPMQAEAPPNRLGLDFPYDWSNAAMPDETLIAKVLQRARFNDVSKVFAHFGVAKVEQVAQTQGLDLQAGVLGALMPGIRRGVQLATATANQGHQPNVQA